MDTVDRPGPAPLDGPRPRPRPRPVASEPADDDSREQESPARVGWIGEPLPDVRATRPGVRGQRTQGEYCSRLKTFGIDSQLLDGVVKSFINCYESNCYGASEGELVIIMEEEDPADSFLLSLPTFRRKVQLRDQQIGYVFRPIDLDERVQVSCDGRGKVFVSANRPVHILIEDERTDFVVHVFNSVEPQGMELISFRGGEKIKEMI